MSFRFDEEVTGPSSVVCSVRLIVKRRAAPREGRVVAAPRAAVE